MKNYIDISEFTSQNYQDFQTEASNLNWPAGEWPAEFNLRDRDRTWIAEKRCQHFGADGNLQYVTYEAGGVTLKIWND